MGAPKVTVLLPVRNGERFLKAALDSVLQQSFASYELLVVNDGSTDGTTDILSSCSNRRLRVTDNPGPPGFDAALNHGLALARGEYIARMDADDVSVPDRLHRQVGFLDRHPDIGVVGANAQRIDEHGKPVGRPARNLPTLPQHVRWRLFLYNCLNHPTVMLRTALLRELGGYDPATFPADDYDLWLRSSSVTKIANLPEVLLCYRRHGASVTSTSSRSQKVVKELEVLSVAHVREFGIPVSPSALGIMRGSEPAADGGRSRHAAAEAIAALVRVTDSCLARSSSHREEALICGAAARRLAGMLAGAAPDQLAGAWRVLPWGGSHVLRYLFRGGVAALVSRMRAVQWQGVRGG